MRITQFSVRLNHPLFCRILISTNEINYHFPDLAYNSLLVYNDGKKYSIPHVDWFGFLGGP
jgi:hypothetical protein